MRVRVHVRDGMALVHVHIRAHIHARTCSRADTVRRSRRSARGGPRAHHVACVRLAVPMAMAMRMRRMLLVRPGQELAHLRSDRRGGHDRLELLLGVVRVVRDERAVDLEGAHAGDRRGDLVLRCGLFREERRVREGVEWDAACERLGLVRHPDDLLHDPLQELLLPRCSRREPSQFRCGEGGESGCDVLPMGDLLP